VSSARFEVLVIADNCTDQTASIARAKGVQVLERNDATQRGKPFGIAWALQHTDLERFDAVSIVDADCVVAEDFAQRLAAVPNLRDVIAQPFIDVSNAGDSHVTTLASLYGFANNGVAFATKVRAGLNVPVGVGFAMGTGLLRRNGWTAFSICEDWELYAQLTARGERIVSAPKARISAQEARNLQQGETQRTRWQAGKQWVLRTYGAAILSSSTISWRQKLNAIAELTGFGPVVSGVLALAVALGGAATGGAAGYAIAAVSLTPILRQVIYACLALRFVPDRSAVGRALMHLPMYAASRVVIAMRSVLSPPGSAWIRAERHADD